MQPVWSALFSLVWYPFQVGRKPRLCDWSFDLFKNMFNIENMDAYSLNFENIKKTWSCFRKYDPHCTKIVKNFESIVKTLPNKKISNKLPWVARWKTTHVGIQHNPHGPVFPAPLYAAIIEQHHKWPTVTPPVCCSHTFWLVTKKLLREKQQRATFETLITFLIFEKNNIYSEPSIKSDTRQHSWFLRSLKTYC